MSPLGSHALHALTTHAFKDDWSPVGLFFFIAHSFKGYLVTPWTHVNMNAKKCHLVVEVNFYQQYCIEFADNVDMTQLLLLGKFEYTGGPIFKVVLEC